MPIFWYFGSRRNQDESWNILIKSAAREPDAAVEVGHLCRGDLHGGALALAVNLWLRLASNWLIFNFSRTLRRSFSAVSMPIFTRKGSSIHFELHVQKNFDYTLKFEIPSARFASSRTAQISECLQILSYISVILKHKKECNVVWISLNLSCINF